ncbi:MAG: HAMP domain-containing sensor histidine kinase [Candidatus Nanopelagicales bacterium]|nr:HAMP domain-containing sensor histidine kinase [Candidatus Nanopelagicales bacterium]MDZ4250805.1 HAMP domain-containing sensor histidine kinase [Candidatus Nanopelagicales bacterium]
MTESRQGFLRTVSGRTVLLAAGVAVLTAVVAVAVSIPLILGASKTQEQVTLDRLADVTVEALQRPSPMGATMRLRQSLAAQRVTPYVVGPELEVPPGLDRAQVAAIIAGDRLSTTVTVSGDSYFVAGRPIDGRYGLVLLAPAQLAGDSADEAVRRLLVALAIGVLVAAGIGYLASRRLTSPLRQAADAAERLSSGERGLRLDPEGPAEVADIATSLNQLSQALARSEGRQREFLLSVSHELRTPLTAVRGYAEALADGLVDPSEVASTGAVMTRESDRLDRLVSDLLDLARLGAAEVAVEVVVIDMSEVCAQAAEVWSDRCQREGVVFTPDISSGVFVRADPTRARQVIDNLAENALRVTPSGARIVLALRREDGDAVIEVRDGGPGLSDDDMAVAFEPAALYARYRGIRDVGSGVGLALVGRLAARQGGRARVERSAEGGAAFQVRMPLVLPEGGSPVTHS